MDPDACTEATMRSHSGLSWLPRAVLSGLFLFASWTVPVRAQSGGPTVSSSGVGYIDNAIPGSQFRLRYDTASNFRRPNRVEFFWAQGAPGGPGVPLPERSVDYQELNAYAEMAWGEQPRFSIFCEVPARLVNPDVNANTAGLSDMNAGFKYALIREENLVVTSQLRVFAPIGDASRGLGNRHVSLEPGLLLFSPLTERLAVEGELRYWAPVGGTSFAGDLIRYGVGTRYDLFGNDTLRISPVAELVGWTALGGKEAVVGPSGQALVESARGDSILTGLLGMRVSFAGGASVYASYGRPLTGDRWYENAVRVEFRLTY
jgi:hypothetical protein